MLRAEAMLTDPAGHVIDACGPTGTRGPNPGALFDGGGDGAGGGVGDTRRCRIDTGNRAESDVLSTAVDLPGSPLQAPTTDASSEVAHIEKMFVTAHDGRFGRVNIPQVLADAAIARTYQALPPHLVLR